MKQSTESLILVTGASGFIGSNVVRHLNQQGKTNLLLVDDLKSSTKWQNLVGKSFVDLISKESLFPFLNDHGKKIEAVIHLGACSSTVEQDASYLLENNTHFSMKLGEWSLENNKKFIYASSAATYGDGLLGFDDKTTDLLQYKPLNMYGYSKHLFDLWLQRQGVLDKVVGLKYFNVFGPNEAHKGRMASVVHHFVPMIKKEGKIKLFASDDPAYKNGDQVRDFIFVDDAARMTTAFLNTPASVGGLFNIGSGYPTTWNTIATSIFEAMDQPVNIEYIPLPEDLKGKYQNYTCAKMDKTFDALSSQANCLTIPHAVKKYVKEFILPGRLW